MRDRPIVTLGAYVDILTGYPFTSRNYVDTGVRLLRGDNVAQGRLRWEGVKCWPSDVSTDLERYRLAAGDVVLAMDRPWIEAGLKFAPVRSNDLPSLLVQRVARLRARDGLDQGFLRFIIGSSNFVQHVLAVQTGSAVPHISSEQIRQFKFRLPVLREQIQIAEVLGALDDKIDANARLVPMLRDLAKTRLQAAVVAEPTYQVRDVAGVRKGLSYTGAGLADGGMPMVNLANAENYGWLKRSGFKYYTGRYRPRHVAQPGSLLIAGVEQTWRHEIIGWPLLLPYDIGEALFSQDVFLVDFRPDHAWLRLPLWAHLYRSDVRSRLEGMVYGTTVARFPAEALTGLEFSAPRQHDPVLDAADGLLHRAWAAERETAALAGLRDALLPPLISGELRVREAESLVGEAV